MYNSDYLEESMNTQDIQKPIYGVTRYYPESYPMIWNFHNIWEAQSGARSSADMLEL